MTFLPLVWRSWPWHRMAQTLGVAVGFSLLFMASVNLASLPGKITAIWFPAAFTLATLLRYGPTIVPGVLVGSFAIVMVGLWDTGLPWPSMLWASLVFACCETLQPLLMAWILQRMQRPVPPLVARWPISGAETWFQTVPRVLRFIGASVVSPMLPALAGSLTWQAVGLIEPADVPLTWLTWWLPAAMAHLIFAPPLLLLHRPQRQQEPREPPTQDSIGLFCAFILLLYLTFGRGYPIDYIFLPLLMLVVFRLGLLSASLCLAIITVVAIYATNLGLGAFVREAPHESFLYLQSFLAVLSLTILILSAVITERKASQSRLEETLASLELQVEKRAEALRQSENILAGLFAASPVGLGILDESLRLVRMNPVLANLGFSSHVPLGEGSIVMPDLAQAIQSACQQVVRTQTALIDQEVETGPETATTDRDERRTWLVSCFPIQNSHSSTTQVGVVLLEISDRKRLEASLQQQAEMDALTHLANRRAFDRHLAIAWNRCLRSQQPLTLILCDVDHFKAYNDYYGHPMGDQCLVQVAQVIQQSACRPGDLAVRYGGEEFALLLPSTSLEAASQIATTLQAHLRELAIVHADSAVSHYVTLSLGLATHIPQPSEFPKTLILAADQALYAAKRQGRNCWVAGEI